MLDLVYITTLLAVSAGLYLSMADDTTGSNQAGSAAPHAFHDFTVKDIAGNDVALAKYKGDVCLVVNVASR